jgi:hypothetical protein
MPPGKVCRPLLLLPKLSPGRLPGLFLRFGGAASVAPEALRRQHRVQRAQVQLADLPQAFSPSGRLSSHTWQSAWMLEQLLHRVTSAPLLRAPVLRVAIAHARLAGGLALVIGLHSLCPGQNVVTLGSVLACGLPSSGGDSFQGS